MKLLICYGGPISVRYRFTDCIRHAALLPLKESSTFAHQARNGNVICSMSVDYIIQKH
jgi:hypothetical protein